MSNARYDADLRPLKFLAILKSIEEGNGQLMSDSFDPSAAPRTTPPTLSQQVPPREREEPKKNRLGLIAFIFSLLGVFPLPLIGQLVGLICGIVAVRREPRGLAIAAIAISVLGGCLVLPLVMLPALLLPALAKARVSARTAMTQSGAQQVQQSIDAFRAKRQRMPKDMVELAADVGWTATDGWDNEFRFVVLTKDGVEGYEIYSAGEDGVWDTIDDTQVFSTFVAPAVIDPKPTEEDGESSDADDDME